MYAINRFITISLLPSAVADIGGERFYAWVHRLPGLVGSVAATTVIGRS